MTRTLSTLLFLALLVFGGCASKETASAAEIPKKEYKEQLQDVQVFSMPNTEAKITPKIIEERFTQVGLEVPGNNDMNIPFKKRFKKVHYSVYNLAMYQDPALSLKLVKKYPNFGALIPLTMSIWVDKDNSINIATLSLEGMSRATGIPANDPNLIAYAQKIDAALHKALPEGSYKKLPFHPAPRDKKLATDFVFDVDLEGKDPLEWKEDAETEFEAEMEPLGFLFPNYTNLQEEMFDDDNYHAYDFYDTYSICKFDVIYPVSKLHPEAGAWAPCSFYFYKRKGENKVHLGWLSVENWITSLDIEDEESTHALRDAQGKIEVILKELFE